MTPLEEARIESDNLFSHVNPSAIYDRPISERHRMIFYLGHLEAFDWNQMKQIGMTAASPTPEFDNLFALGIDPEPGQLPSDKPSDWPSLKQVEQYNKGVRQIIDDHLHMASPESQAMMVEHRHMHAETFGYILHNLDLEKKSGPKDNIPNETPVAAEMISIPAGTAILGRTRDSTFGWDNEFQEVRKPVPQFEMTRYKITNGEWLDYMKLTGSAAPHYWFQQDDTWYYKGIFQDVPLPLTWPVYVTWNQAADYAKFRGLSLPTEAQFDRAAYGEENAAIPAGNYDYHRWDPVPVNYDQGSGVAQLVGNGWEWTSDVFAPFPGFAPHPTYPGYSANFFDNSHYVLKGASPRTSSALVRRSLRNWFRPEYPYVYATFHLVQN